MSYAAFLVALKIRLATRPYPFGMYAYASLIGVCLIALFSFVMGLATFDAAKVPGSAWGAVVYCGVVVSFWAHGELPAFVEGVCTRRGECTHTAHRLAHAPRHTCIHTYVRSLQLVGAEQDLRLHPRALHVPLAVPDRLPGLPRVGRQHRLGHRRHRPGAQRDGYGCDLMIDMRGWLAKWRAGTQALAVHSFDPFFHVSSLFNRKCSS